MDSSAGMNGGNLVGGQWIAGGGSGFQVVDPRTGLDLPTTFHESTGHDVDVAFAAAARAFAATRAVGAEQWAGLLEAIAEQLVELGDLLLARAMGETALTEARLVGERARTCTQLHLYARLAREGAWLEPVVDRADPDRKPLPKPDIRRLFVPLGPVAVFDAGNFPFAYGACGGDTACALAVGCPVVVKAHPGHAGADELVALAILRALRQVGLPDGLFNMVHGGAETGRLVASHPACEAIGFTGSLRGGRALFDAVAARPRPIPVFAEMGSVNPIAILPGAIAERGEQVAQGLCNSVTQGGGQFCTKPGLLFLVDDPSSAAFLADLAARMAAVSPCTLLSPVGAAGYRRAGERITGSQGVTALVAGSAAGLFAFTPSLYAVQSTDWAAQPGLHAEAFGPCTIAVLCRSVADLLETIGALEGQLTGSLMVGEGDDPGDVGEASRVLMGRVGRFIFNGYPTGVEVCAAQVHGGPYPATTFPNATSVGDLAIRRFVRPVAFQNVPDGLLPPALQRANPMGLDRLVDGAITRDPA